MPLGLMNSFLKVIPGISFRLPSYSTVTDLARFLG